MLSTTLMMFAPGCRWMFTMTAGTLSIHAESSAFSTPSTTLATSVSMTGAPLLVGEHDLLEFLAGGDLIVGADLKTLRRAVEAALGGVETGRRERRAHVLQIEAIGGELRGIDLDAHGRLLAAADGHGADARQLGNLLREARVRIVLDLRQRHGVRRQREGQNRARLRG